MKHVGYFFVFFAAVEVQAQKGFVLADVPSKKKVEVLFDGKLLTAYCYFDSTEKPVLFPIKTLSGITITRGFPIAPRPGERTDHPHHVGLWLNYESVNGLDFWNNSKAISAERKPRYGSIRHQRIVAMKSGKQGELETLSHWVNQDGQVLLEERTRFLFRRSESDFIIDRTSTLEAKVPEVAFRDVKDGMLGLRVARELEMPSKEASKFVDVHGQVTEVPILSNDAVTGMYFNQEGVRGDAVWSSRSRWACLQGRKDGTDVAIVIIDHPANVGYPTYWHARGYGLFAANPLGQKAFSNGKEELNFSLKQGGSVAFRHRVVIHNGKPLTPDAINLLADRFGAVK